MLNLFKIIINSVLNMAKPITTQMFATMFDGVARHSPEGKWFEQRAQEAGFKQAVAERDSGEPIAPGVSKDFKDLGLF